MGWSSGAFLVYAGIVVVVIAILLLLESLNGTGDDFGLFGWASLVLAGVAAVAVLLRRAGHDLLPGLAAFVGLIVFAVWVGAFEDWAGFFPEDRDDHFFAESLGHLDPGLLLLEAAVLAAGIFALRFFRFPLLVLPVAIVLWYALVDFLSAVFYAGSDGHALLSIFVGLALAATGVWLDRSGRAPYGFWVHVVGGLAAGGGLLELLGRGTWRWVLLGLCSLAFVAAARTLARSSYAVLGAIGVLTVGGHFIEEWFSVPPPITYVFPFFFFGEGGDTPEFEGFLAYIVLGLILVALGLLVERGLARRKPAG